MVTNVWSAATDWRASKFLYFSVSLWIARQWSLRSYTHCVTTGTGKVNYREVRMRAVLWTRRCLPHGPLSPQFLFFFLFSRVWTMHAHAATRSLIVSPDSGKKKKKVKGGRPSLGPTVTSCLFLLFIWDVGPDLLGGYAFHHLRWRVSERSERILFLFFHSLDWFLITTSWSHMVWVQTYGRKRKRRKAAVQ